MMALGFSSMSNAKYTSSKDCEAFIMDAEGCYLKAYWDSNGYSIGYGHHSNVEANETISQGKAMELLHQDIKEAEKQVNYLIGKLPYKYEFSQGFIDGFTSFVFNVGVANAERSAFFERLMKCRVKDGIMDETDYAFTMAAIKSSYANSKGHIKRRCGEYRMMMKM